MSLVMTLLVRDEEDILDANLRYHLDQGVEHVFVTDNLSADGTRDRLRTKEVTAIARAKGRLRGKQPELSEKQRKELTRMHVSGDYSTNDPAGLFAVSRPTIYRTLQRTGAKIGPKCTILPPPASDPITRNFIWML